MALNLAEVSIRLRHSVLLQPFSLIIPEGEIVTLMGPSGSGKSSLLSLIAGDLGQPFAGAGRIALDGAPLQGLPPERRRIGRLFQDDLLFPHLTVGENLMFGMPRAIGQRREKMQDALRAIELDGFEHRPPHTLSGGQRSRVALMRALLADPRAMLLDEPFGKLDTGLKSSVRALVFSRLKMRSIPCLLVTHDRADAPDGGRILCIGEGGEVRDA